MQYYYARRTVLENTQLIFEKNSIFDGQKKKEFFYLHLLLRSIIIYAIHGYKRKYISLLCTLDTAQEDVPKQ